MTAPDHEVVIIGAGPGGIAAAHLLQQKGIHDFLIVDRGDDFVDHFAATREWEHRQWQDAVTDWELKRYFEII